MALTTVPDKAIGDVFTEAMWDTYIRDNLNDHKNFAQGAAPFPGASQAFANDGNFTVSMSGTAAQILFATVGGYDYFQYERSIDRFRFWINSVEQFAIDSSGRIQAAAFESAETTITAGNTANIAHGLGVRPRFFGALYGTASGITNCVNLVVPSFNSLGAFPRLSQVGASNLNVVNDTAVTIYVYAFALR